MCCFKVDVIAEMPEHVVSPCSPVDSNVLELGSQWMGMTLRQRSLLRNPMNTTNTTYGILFMEAYLDEVASLLLKYLLKRIQIFLPRDDLLNLRETSQFHAPSERFGPGWTVISSPLIHVVR